MANRVAIALVALVVGLTLYVGFGAVEDALTAPDGVAATGDVVAVNATMHLDHVGRPTVVGEVHNGRRTAVTGVTVTVRFTKDGSTLGTASDRTLVPTMPALSAAPFSIRLPDPSARPDDYAVSVTYDTAPSRPYRGLRVTTSSISDKSQTRVTVVGAVKNTGRKTVRTTVVATFYDDHGNVVGVRAVPPSPGLLEPGATGEFTVQLRTLGELPSRAGDVSHYSVTAYGEPAS